MDPSAAIRTVPLVSTNALFREGVNMLWSVGPEDVLIYSEETWSRSSLENPFRASRMSIIKADATAERSPVPNVNYEHIVPRSSTK